MKLTQSGQTLFHMICTLFVDKAGHALTKRAFGEKTQLVALRDKENHIVKINLVFLKTPIMTIQENPNSIFMDVTGWFTQASINRLNKALAYVDMNIRKVNGSWVISDRSGQQAAFRNAEVLDLTRPHGSAIYPQTEVTQQQ